MHLGRNNNRSVFKKDVVIRALYSLRNTPILGYIEDGLFENDFKGHEHEVSYVNGNRKEKYIGEAFGVIPEDCNPRFEFKESEDGSVYEYLVVDGILWTKFEDAIEILDRDNIVGQSMELHDEFDGYFDDEGYFVFTDIKFYGACMLGKNYQPAMNQASVERVFSVNKAQIEKTISEKLSEYYSLYTNKGVSEVANEVVNEEINEEVNETSTNSTQEETSVNTNEEVANNFEEDTNNTDTKDVEDQNEEENTDEVKEEANEEVNEEVEETETNFQLQVAEYQSNIESLQSQLETTNSSLGEITKERDELLEFKKNVLKENHENMVSELLVEFSKKLESEDIEEIRSVQHEFTYEELEVKLYEKLGRKMLSFTKKENTPATNFMKINIDETANPNSLEAIYMKHGYSPINN